MSLLTFILIRLNFLVEFSGNNNISQVMSVILPDIYGTFQLECEARTFLFNHSVTSRINITIGSEGGVVSFD